MSCATKSTGPAGAAPRNALAASAIRAAAVTERRCLEFMPPSSLRPRGCQAVSCRTAPRRGSRPGADSGSRGDSQRAARGCASTKENGRRRCGAARPWISPSIISPIWLKTRPGDRLQPAKEIAMARGETIDVNGFQLYYEERGDGDPLLLLHGGTGIGGDWQHVFTSGDPGGYRLIVPDLRGHG